MGSIEAAAPCGGDEEGQPSALDDALAPLSVVAVALARALEPLGADAGFVAARSVDGASAEVARVTPFRGEPVRLSFPLEAPYPLVETLRTGKQLFIESNEKLACDHPGLVRVVSEDHACATLPLVDDAGRIVAAINLGFDEPRPFTDDDRACFEYVAARCAAVFAAVS